MFSITLTNQNTVIGIQTAQTVTYTSDESASLDHVGIVCEYLCEMVLPYNEGDDDD